MCIRDRGRPCVSGSSEIDINYEAKTFKTSSIEVKEGDIITIDGSTGRIILGEVTTVKPEISGDFSKLMSWADGFRKLKVRTTQKHHLIQKQHETLGQRVLVFVEQSICFLMKKEFCQLEK